MNKLPAVAAALVSLALVPTAKAADVVGAAAPTPSVHVDAEVDPTAYALSGYSVHLGLGHGRTRLDLGAFAMAVPQFIHGTEGLGVRFDGFGAKLHHFVFAAPNEQRGLFVGIDGGLNRVRVENTATGETASANQIGFGAHVGYRIELPFRLYATPWVGVSYAINARDLSAGGATLKATPWTIFPAVHLGYRFL